jgi:hypothetical protein
MVARSAVTDDYSTGALLAAIRAGTASVGLTPETVSVDDLGGACLDMPFEDATFGGAWSSAAWSPRDHGAGRADEDRQHGDRSRSERARPGRRDLPAVELTIAAGV